MSNSPFDKLNNVLYYNSDNQTSETICDVGSASLNELRVQC